jgi:phosphate transport system protein
MMRTRFQQGLDSLKDKLLRMAGLAEQAVDRSIRAYQQRDRTACELVFQTEQAINMAEREIDELALDLLAMQQPMAVDLRFILSVIKINADLERVGDQAVNIAQRVRDFLELPPAALPVDLPRIAQIAAEMIHQSLEAFVHADDKLAQDVLVMDNTVDQLKVETETVLLDEMRQSPQFIRQALDLLLISRNLERVADHATNIAEDVIFWVRGADVRHHGGGSATPH